MEKKERKVEYLYLKAKSDSTNSESRTALVLTNMKHKLIAAKMPYPESDN